MGHYGSIPLLAQYGEERDLYGWCDSKMPGWLCQEASSGNICCTVLTSRDSEEVYK